jgi:hypothetical protein
MFFFVAKCAAADAMDTPQPWSLLCDPVMKMIRLFPFFRVMEHRWNGIDGKTDVLGENSVPVSLCRPQIRHRVTWDRTRASAVRDRRLTAWGMARPSSRSTGQPQGSECSNGTYKVCRFYVACVLNLDQKVAYPEQCFPLLPQSKAPS